MYILNPKRIAMLTANVLFFVIATILNIVSATGLLHCNKLVMNVVFLMIVLAVVTLLSKLRDYTISDDGIGVDLLNDFDFFTQQIKFVSVTSISFFIWML